MASINICINLGFPANINALKCKALKSVKKSTYSLRDNVRYGGHVWQHIGHLTSKPSGAVAGDTQLNKSLFSTGSDFKKAWTNLVGKATCPTAGVKTDKDCTRASTLGIYNAYQCRAVDKNKLCTSMKSFTPISVEFYYYRHNVYGWILRTAFPSARSC